MISRDNAKKKNSKIEWNSKCDEAFLKLKQICTSTPVLAYAIYRKAFRVHTDASEFGLGTVLYQEQEGGTMHVIAYASQSISNAESRYHSSKLEFLALKWAVCEQFHEYLYGGTFDVFTDNNPLTYVLTTAKLKATTQCWVASLANYNFKIFYKGGKQNVEADALSMIEWNKMKVVAALERGCTAESSLPLPPQAVVYKTQTISHLEPKLSAIDWRREQLNDLDISSVL